MLYNRIVSWIVGSAWLIAWSGMDHLVVLTDDALQYYKSVFRNKVSRIYNGKNLTPDPGQILPQHKVLIAEMRDQFQYVIGVYSALIKKKN